MANNHPLQGEVNEVSPRTSPTFRRRRLARRIRQLREKSGLTQERAAAGLDMSTSALSRKENGDAATSVHEARSMMDLYDIYDEQLLDLARAAREKGWWRAYGIEDRGYVDLETEASTVRELSLMHIPGLLQTEDYMRAVISSGLPQSTTRYEDHVAVRRIRQQRLTAAEHPIELTAVVDEVALRRPVGGSEVMRKQLESLATSAELPRVRLHVLPLGDGAHAGMDGAFILIGFPELDDRDVLFLSHPAGSLHVENEAEVGKAKLVFDHVLSKAVSVDASIELIKRLAREL